MFGQYVIGKNQPGIHRASFALFWLQSHFDMLTCGTSAYYSWQNVHGILDTQRVSHLHIYG